MAWTTKSIQAIQGKPPAAPKRVFEQGDTPGFCVQLMPSGTTTPYMQFTTASGKRQFHRLGTKLKAGQDAKTIGSWLQQARRAAEDARSLLDRGKDPKVQARKAAGGVVGTLGKLLDVYLQSLEGASTYRQIEQSIERDIREQVVTHDEARVSITDLPANTVTAKQIAQVLAKVRRRAQGKGHVGDAAVRKTRVHLRAAYELARVFDADETMMNRYGIELQFSVTNNPVDSTPKIKTGAPRERVLDRADIRKVWHVLDDLEDKRAALILKLLFLTGWRKSVVCGLRHDEIEEDVIHIRPDAGPGRNKTKAHLFLPITPDIRAVLDEAARYWSPEQHVCIFPNSERRKLDHYQPTKLNHQIRFNICKATGVAHFSPHDIRRTAITEMKRAGVDGIVRRLIVGHAVQGDNQGDAHDVHYTVLDWQQDYREPVTAGLLRWHQALRDIIDPKGDDTVVPIRKQAAS